MKRITFFFSIILVATFNLYGQNFIEVIEPSVNIRFKPSLSSTIISQAKKGNIFELEEKTGNWYGILMFSGEYRYIYKSMCKKTNYSVKVPDNAQLKKTVFKELLKAEDKASFEALKKYPNDIDREIDYERILNDIYKLNVLNKFGLQPPIYSKLILEGVNKNWEK